MRTRIDSFLEPGISNPGILWSYGNPTPAPDENTEQASTKQQKFLGRFEGSQEAGRSAYEKAYAAWNQDLRDLDARIETWRTSWWLSIGHGMAHPSEIGLRLSTPYGFPVIPGSALKGLTHAYAQTRFELPAGLGAVLFGRGPEKEEDSGDAGGLVFYDAWWVPEAASPFKVDTITVHHPYYYQGRDDLPGDSDSPTPLAHLSVAGSFLFAVGGLLELRELGCRLLGTALADWGIGARTRKGYGRFDTGFPVPEAQLREVVPGTAPPARLGRPGAPPSSPGDPTSVAVTILYRPNDGSFEVLAEGVRARAPAKQGGLFESDEAREWAIKRSRARGAIPAEAVIVREGSLVHVRAIRPKR